MRSFAWLPIFALAASCSSSPPGTVVSFDLTADLTQQAHFFDFPYPSDLRLNANGGPDLTGFPNPRALDLVNGLAAEGAQRKGFPVVPVAYFQFSAAMPAGDPDTVIPAAATSPVLLVDTDENSPDRGKLFPTVSVSPPSDDFVPNNLLAVAARPGFILIGGRKYAFVVLRSFGDLTGAKLGVASTLATLESGGTPTAAQGSAAAALYAPLWTTLKNLGVDAKEVAAAAVFTTGDVVADTEALSQGVLAKYSVTIDGLAVNFPNQGDMQDRFCELTGTVTYPQFQAGTPPFNTDGLFQFTDGTLPAKQRDEVAPIVITLPYGTDGTMPAGGYPLTVYFHGSGGVSTEVVDRGPVMVMNGPEQPGHGPAYVMGAFTVATAGSALPVNPQRLPGATEIAYLNFNNLPAFRDTFRQGIVEQRMFLEALRTLTIDPSVVASGCTNAPAGVTLKLPAGETSFHFNPDKLTVQGQSMGGMYSNLISATEPRIKAVVPTGAGGFWSFFILKTSLIQNAAGAVAAILGSDALTFLHPAMSLLETAWEPADPIVYMPRVSRRPLPNFPARPIYEPVGEGDSYFPTVLYDAIALAYGHQEVGDEVWPTMQDALKLDGLDGILPYPVKQNRMSENGQPYTGIVVQYMGDGIYDPHAIAAQLDSVKYQYGCFVATFLKNGVATVGAPMPLGTACAE